MKVEGGGGLKNSERRIRVTVEGIAGINRLIVLLEQRNKNILC